MTLLMAAFAAIAHAQTAANLLTVPNLQVKAGATARVPIALENADEAVAMQLDIVLPSGITYSSGGVSLSERAKSTHSVTARMMSDDLCRIIVISNKNKAVKGNAGELVYLNINIPASLTEKDTCQLQMRNIVVSDISGNDLPVVTSIGHITVASMPDLSVDDFRVNIGEIYPGDKIDMEWTVANKGDLPTTGGWTEQISISGIDGGSKLLTSLSYENTLAPQATVTRKATVTIPDVPTVDGASVFVVKVVPDPDAGEPASALINNEMMTENTVFVNKRLYLNISTDINENYYNPNGISGYVTRSGNRMDSETFALNIMPADPRISLPQSVTIPAGESTKYFTYKIYDNSVLDNDSVFTISLTGNEYDDITKTLKLHDNELPRLTIEIPDSEISEGEEFTAKVTAERAPLSDLNIRLTTNEPSRFSIPDYITIPAGQTTATFRGSAIDNNDPQLDETFRIRASAPLYKSYSADIRILDNDIPAIALDIKPKVFGEGNDSTEIKAILTRTTNIDKRVTVNISDNRSGQLKYVKQTVMEAGVDKVEIPITPIDNATVDYSRDITLTARVYLAANAVEATASTPGYTTAGARILDDDGKTLTLTPVRTVWSEGSTNYLIVSRNTTNTEGAVTVTLSSNQDSRLEYANTLTIPSGSTTGRLRVNVKRNTTDNDDFETMFTVTAPDYNDGVCMVAVSDASLADAEVSLRLSETTAEINSAISAVATISNNGFLTLPAETEVAIYNNTGERVAISKLTEAIEPDKSSILTFALTASDEVESKGYYAVVNESRSVKEMSYANNRSKTAYLTMTPGFTTTLTTDKTLYGPGETVIITGKATGNHAAYAPVCVVVSATGNFRKAIDVECDNEGNFTAEWIPYAGQAGRFSITSSHPRTPNDKEQASVELYGLQLWTRNYTVFDIEEGETVDFDIKVHNPGPNLTDVKTEVINAPSNYSITFDNADIDVQNSGTTAIIPMHLTGLSPSATEAYDSIYVRISTKEGPIVSTIHLAHCRPNKAQLRVTPANLDLTLIKGKEREIHVDITNSGLRESGEVYLSARQWVTSSSPIASIKPGETVTASIMLKAPANAIPEERYPESLVSFSCENGNGTSMKLGVTVVSEDKGSLVLTASDDRTYNLDTHPHLSGAEVIISRSYTGETLYSGVTDTDGVFRIDSITEGYYDVYVTADNHDSYSKQHLLINPGVINELEAMLYICPVAEMVIPGEDPLPGFDIKPLITFQDAAPAIVINLPKERPSLNMIFPIEVTNHGSVAVGRTSMSFTVPEGFEMEICDKPFLNMISPNSTVTFYAALRAISDDADPSDANFAYKATVHAQYRCGPYSKIIDSSASKSWGTSDPSSIFEPTEPKPGSIALPAPSIPSGNRFRAGNANNLVSLQLSRTTMMARQNAFAYFTVINNSDSQIDNIRFDIRILDSNGKYVENTDSFAITLHSLQGFTGKADINGPWSIPANTTGVATIKITPALETALNQPTQYSIGGAMYHSDTTDGMTVKTKIMNIPFYVNPQAVLDLTYFLQRDIYGDDASTPDVTEPSIPAELSLLISNKGNGIASNVTLIMPKPEIKTNTSNPTLEFKLVGSQLNGAPFTSNIGNDIITRFGNIANGSTAYAQWWLQSNFTGHFINYGLIHTKLGSSDIDESIIVDNNVKEMIHSINIDNTGNHPLKGFLVNDVEDDYDMPDHIYLTDNTVAEVHAIDNAKITNGKGTEYTLQVTPGKNGWNYGSVNDPTGGRQKLESVTRLKDNKDIDVHNFWQTDRTMPDGVTPIREHRIHFADMFGNETQSYKLTFSYVSEKVLDIVAFEGLTGASCEISPINQLKVVFNKPINAGTLTPDVLALTCDGKELDNEQINISAINDKEYIIDMSKCTGANGCYILSVDTRKIVDAEGFVGDGPRFAEWLQFLSGKVALSITAQPEQGGTVSPQNDSYKYGEKITLKAVAAEGYTFSHWTRDGEILAMTEDVSVIPVDSVSYIAHFETRKYYVEVLSEGGTLSGPGTGYYNYGEKLDMKVNALTGWSFQGWRLNGKGHTKSKNISITVEDDNIVEACFISRKSDVTIKVPEGWSWITSTLSDMAYSTPQGLLADVADNVECLRDTHGEFLNDPVHGFINGIAHLTPANSYKLKMKQADEISHYGRIALNADIRLYISDGWTWLGYVPAVEMDIATAFSGFAPEEDDVIKGMTGFATWAEGAWRGTLETLQPTQGYMYLSKSPKTFFYPNNYMAYTDTQKTPPTDNSVSWIVDEHKYSDNATVIANIRDDRRDVSSSRYTVGAFVDDECRGIGQWIDGRVFLTVHGDSTDRYVTFRVIDHITGEEIKISEGFNFEVSHVGTYSNPYLLHLNTVSGVNGVATEEKTWTICPNPVKSILYIAGDENAIKAVSVISLAGSVLMPYQDYISESGLDVSVLAEGHYILAISTDNGVVYRRFIKLN